MPVRVTRILCPACNGAGTMGGTRTRFACGWCRGSKRLPAADAVRYARSLRALGTGGYLAGDHELEHARRMEARADRILGLLQPL